MTQHPRTNGNAGKATAVVGGAPRIPRNNGTNTTTAIDNMPTLPSLMSLRYSAVLSTSFPNRAEQHPLDPFLPLAQARAKQQREYVQSVLQEALSILDEDDEEDWL